ncbi:sigma-70 family RNA polymerase sigma factor [Niabella pedocola]|uniref:Sigma-70 family RNA polymerase sigma factor n=1 Tax=Niabella pedocola TaxID=1752077 RepID=A0ABS8PV05_9BACT|nr:sigma-70 family RNA polymerase sigma factor [Niabella pedocola]MCD2424904.1 sigma-70 family RNA polymerase sigma factor [Niabella pedocola]
MRATGTLEDYNLWQSLKEGNQEALATIYFTHFKNLYEYGLRIVQDKELVKDAIQDLFIKLWTNRTGFEDISKIRPYLLIALRSGLYNKLQQKEKRPVRPLGAGEEFDMVFSAESIYIDKESFSQQTQQLVHALNQLTAKQKEVVYLRYFEELDYEEIAKVMGSSLKSVYKLKARGLDALKQLLNISNTSLVMLFAACRAELFS